MKPLITRIFFTALGLFLMLASALLMIYAVITILTYAPLWLIISLGFIGAASIIYFMIIKETKSNGKNT